MPGGPRCVWALRSLGRSFWSQARGHLAEAGAFHQVMSSSRAFSLAVTECFVPVLCTLCLKTTKQCLVTVACAQILGGGHGAALQKEALGKAAVLALKNVSNGEGMCVQLSNYVFKQTWVLLQLSSLSPYRVSLIELSARRLLMFNKGDTKEK